MTLAKALKNEALESRRKRRRKRRGSRKAGGEEAGGGKAGAKRPEASELETQAKNKRFLVFILREQREAISDFTWGGAWLDLHLKTARKTGMFLARSCPPSKELLLRLPPRWREGTLEADGLCSQLSFTHCSRDLGQGASSL